MYLLKGVAVDVAKVPNWTTRSDIWHVNSVANQHTGIHVSKGTPHSYTAHFLQSTSSQEVHHGKCEAKCYSKGRKLQLRKTSGVDGFKQHANLNLRMHTRWEILFTPLFATLSWREQSFNSLTIAMGDFLHELMQHNCSNVVTNRENTLELVIPVVCWKKQRVLRRFLLEKEKSYLSKTNIIRKNKSPHGCQN